MGFWSSVGSICSSVVSSVSNAISSGWEKTKEICSNAVGWMADKAERFVGNIKDIWNTAKSYIPAIRAGLKAAAAWAPTVGFGWISPALLKFESVLEKIENLGDSNFIKKVEGAINWVIMAARNLKSKKMTETEMAEAQERQETFNQAKEYANDADKHAIDLAALINNYLLVKAGIEKIFSVDVLDDFEHYLRLRATQKLLANVEKTLESAKDIDEVTAEDIFLIQIGAKLLHPKPELSDDETITLNNIVQKKFKKKLTPFIFEEMIVTWGAKLKEIEQQWSINNKAFAKDSSLLRRLEMEEKLVPLSVDDSNLLADLRKTVPLAKVKLDALAKQEREMRHYIFASEGFLQILEKEVEELEAEGKGYLAAEGLRVGMIIIDCAQRGKSWEELLPEEQELIIAFSNIFEEANRERVAQLEEVEVM